MVEGLYQQLAKDIKNNKVTIPETNFDELLKTGGFLSKQQSENFMSRLMRIWFEFECWRQLDYDTKVEMLWEEYTYGD